MTQSPDPALREHVLPVGWQEDDAKRWPVAYTVAFVGVTSAVLWALIIGAMNWLTVGV